MPRIGPTAGAGGGLRDEPSWSGTTTVTGGEFWPLIREVMEPPHPPFSLRPVSMPLVPRRGLRVARLTTGRLRRGSWAMFHGAAEGISREQGGGGGGTVPTQILWGRGSATAWKRRVEGTAHTRLRLPRYRLRRCVSPRGQRSSGRNADGNPSGRPARSRSTSARVHGGGFGTWPEPGSPTVRGGQVCGWCNALLKTPQLGAFQEGAITPSIMRPCDRDSWRRAEQVSRPERDRQTTRRRILWGKCLRPIDQSEAAVKPRHVRLPLHRNHNPACPLAGPNGSESTVTAREAW